ncbi:hypothetical protein [Caenibacillus caldisaponilyticus]|uniref:hypothetical protein n=1 Tax=Caenibacillus caldisaponilyticus TaxID=1674942 RepID=UPI000988456A|nr:hypothetical protein [Caenibacillus caldisaponilyticus]
MKIVNLTPHSINLMPNGADGTEIIIPPSGTVARCATNRVQVGTVDIDGVTISINRTQFGEVEGLPDPQPDTVYIVSSLVAQAVKGQRVDVLIVDDAVRDDQGRIIGARALART